MRLLTFDARGELSITRNFLDDYPTYAILSHTWGEESDEVTFADLDTGRSAGKVGLTKLHFCGRQARKDGIDYFWVDTCCINRANLAEMTEAITSMYRYYGNAAKCYVYLSDVSEQQPNTGKSTKQTWESNFRASRWFTRGWTLQELLAPASVEFFSREEELIGTKSTLQTMIHEITAIPLTAIQGESLDCFSIAERLRWASKRNTKRKEDQAYCLLGIFGVFMPLIYGEGDHAFLRLHEEIEKRSTRKDFGAFYSETTLRALDSSAPPTSVLEITSRPVNPLNAEWHTAQYIQEGVSQQKLLQSLHFAQLRHRRDHVDTAHPLTYQWMLTPVMNRNQQWDSFSTWLGSSNGHQRMFWIHGKPGSGKSTLMRFLDENIDSSPLLSRWAGTRTIIRAQCFFWNSGVPLQKSLIGLLQSLTSQLLEYLPDAIPHVVPSYKLRIAQTSAWQDLHWSVAELRDTLLRYLSYCGHSRIVFLLIDGLDEFEGDEEQRKELIDLLFQLTASENVKICLSSRPWNIFQDAFGNLPQLKLEDLTSDDIDRFVRDELCRHKRFLQWSKYDAPSAENLYVRLVEKAAGVFLWVRLVVRELLTGLRDGDSISALEMKLDHIPAGLNIYFRRLFDSIEPHHRLEASIIFQITLFEEVDFVVVDQVNLINLSFLQENRPPDFLLSNDHSHEALDLNDDDALYFRVESTLRRLNSRCMGLVECYHDPDYAAMSAIDHGHGQSADIKFPLKNSYARGYSDALFRIPLDESFGPVDLFDLRVHFLHRSFRDYLLGPQAQELLQDDAGRPYPVRMFMCNALLATIMAINRKGIATYQSTAFMSGLLSRMAVMDAQEPASLLAFARVVRPVIEHTARNCLFLRSPLYFYYIEPVLESWASEQSSFLSLAIDFGMKSYVTAHLNPEAVSSKVGRPMLDYVLRPRFTMQRGLMNIGNTLPDVDLLRTLLEHGANPNERFLSASVWANFLSFVRESSPQNSVSGFIDADDDAYFSAMTLLLQHGAAKILPKTWLAAKCEYGQYGRPIGSAAGEAEDEIEFEKRWPEVSPVPNCYDGEEFYAVNDILEHLQFRFGARVDILKELLATRNDQDMVISTIKQS